MSSRLQTCSQAAEEPGNSFEAAASSSYNSVTAAPSYGTPSEDLQPNGEENNGVRDEGGATMDVPLPPAARKVQKLPSFLGGKSGCRHVKANSGGMLMPEKAYLCSAPVSRCCD